ncbi:hypothetical protein BDZ45DRAFT_725564 [Acephala macrosclerotiorum]|nr:hypothetical protein BDZ45DRAFT_725564 [Acephala macrosclerotiorum]
MSSISPANGASKSQKATAITRSEEELHLDNMQNLPEERLLKNNSTESEASSSTSTGQHINDASEADSRIATKQKIVEAALEGPRKMLENIRSEMAQIDLFLNNPFLQMSASKFQAQLRKLSTTIWAVNIQSWEKNAKTLVREQSDNHQKLDLELKKTKDRLENTEIMLSRRETRLKEVKEEKSEIEKELTTASNKIRDLEEANKLIAQQQLATTEDEVSEQRIFLVETQENEKEVHTPVEMTSDAKLEDLRKENEERSTKIKALEAQLEKEKQVHIEAERKIRMQETQVTVNTYEEKHIGREKVKELEGKVIKLENQVKAGKADFAIAQESRAEAESKVKQLEEEAQEKENQAIAEREGRITAERKVSVLGPAKKMLEALGSKATDLFVADAKKEKKGTTIVQGKP